MAVASDGGPRADCALAEGGSGHGRGWANVSQVKPGPAGPLGKWADLLASISHELRTPLNAVIGFSDAMQQEVFGPIGNARYQEYVEFIRASGVEMLRAAEDALAMTAVLAEPRTIALEDVPLAAIVAEAVEAVETTACRVRRLITAEIPADLEVRGDGHILPRAIRQMLMVAGSRATPGSAIVVRATSEHGLVELLVEVSSPAPGTAALTAQASPRVCEAGLGRRELTLWLAMALLELLDCRLSIDGADGSLRFRTTLEQSIQGSFFTGGLRALA